MARRNTPRQLELQCSCEGTGDENACISFRIFHTLSTCSAIINPMVSSGCSLKTEENVFFFGDLDTLIHTKCSEFRAGIWPMGRVFPVPAFFTTECVLDLNGAIARIRDFISTSIHFISRSRVALVSLLALVS